MVKPIDITNTVIVPSPQPRQEKLNSFFIGRAPVDNIDEGSVEVEANPKEKIDLLRSIGADLESDSSLENI